MEWLTEKWKRKVANVMGWMLIGLVVVTLVLIPFMWNSSK